MAEFKRSRRVKELLREEISKIITTELKDPFIGMTTVTHVKLTDDLKSARIYVSIHGDEKVREQTLHGLDRASKFIRSQLGSRIELKYTPVLKFFYDERIDYAHKIELILNKIHNEEN